MSGRGNRPPAPQFDGSSRPTAVQVLSIIDTVAGDIDAEFVGVAVTPVLAALATEAMTYAVCSTTEMAFYPDQQHDTSAIWWSRYQGALSRLQNLLAAEGGGVGVTGGVAVISPTLGAFKRVYGGVPAFPDDYPIGW